MRDKRRTGNLNHTIAALADRQHGVVSRRQLRALGLTDRAITARTAAGGLHGVFHGTFAVGHRMIGRHGRMLAAVLACGDGTVLSHGSAAELLGLWGKRAIPVDVIVPRWSGRKIQDVRWHNVLPPESWEIEIREGIPCTTVSRTLVDLAGRVGDRSLQRLVEQAAVLRLLDIRDVDRALARGRRRGAPLLRSILAPWRNEGDHLPRLRSLLEARVLPALVEAGIPRPRCNVELWVEGPPPRGRFALGRARTGDRNGRGGNARDQGGLPARSPARSVLGFSRLSHRAGHLASVRGGTKGGRRSDQAHAQGLTTLPVCLMYP